MISAVVITKNEEKTLPHCLASLSWCDEVVVVDDGSIDATLDTAKRYNARILENSLVDFASQRNFALEKAKYEWVLFIDADEVVSESLRDEIVGTIGDTECDGFFLNREDFLWGKKLQFGDSGGTKLLRLGKRSKGKWQGRVHEEWQITGKTGSIMSPLMHYPHQTVSEFLSEVNYYSDLRAGELYDRGIRSSAIAVVAYPKAKFMANYFFKLGFLDGLHGLVHAIMMSFYSFLVRGKLWLIWDRKSV